MTSSRTSRFVLALALAFATVTGCTGSDDPEPPPSGEPGRFGPILEGAVMPALSTFGMRRVPARAWGRVQNASGVGLEGGYHFVAIPASTGSWCVESDGDGAGRAAVADLVDGRPTVGFHDGSCKDVADAEPAAVVHPRLDSFEVMFDEPLVEGDVASLRRDLATHQRIGLGHSRRMRVEHDALRVARDLEKNGRFVPRRALLDPVRQRELLHNDLSPDSVVTLVERRGAGWRVCVVDDPSRAWALYDSALGYVVGAGESGAACRRLPGYD
jgi:hypothetical protein